MFKVEEPVGDVTSRAGGTRPHHARGGRGCLGLDLSQPSEQTQCLVLFELKVRETDPKIHLGLQQTMVLMRGWGRMATSLGEEGEERLSLGLHFEPLMKSKHFEILPQMTNNVKY